MDFLQRYSGAFTFFATVILAAITAFYAYWTKGILHATINQSKLILNPVIGIRVTNIELCETFGPDRRQMSVDLELTNVGNAPAIEILVDAEIELRYSNIKGKCCIPSRHEPEMVPFLQPGQSNSMMSPNFGNTLVTHFLDDVRESTRLNLHRIATDPTKDPFLASRLRVFVYYKNSLGQYFRSQYETEIDITGDVPKENETAKVTQFNIPRPIFHAITSNKKSFTNEIKARDILRDLCGW